MPTLRSLGGIELQTAERLLLPRRRKELVLLAYLARQSPRSVAREELASLLWGEREEARARHSLRQALSELRAELGDIIEVTPDTIRLLPDQVELDVKAFEAAIERGEEAAAVALWRGEFLAGCEDLGTEALRGWIERERAALRTQLAWACRRVVEGARRSGDWRTAIAAAEQWCAALPYDEAAHRSAVETLRIAGKNAEAAARHASFVSRLQVDLGGTPTEDFVRLGASLTPTGEPARPGERGLLTPDLVGRGDALSRLERAWHAAGEGSGTVAVILGDEGLGKSRLCREFARSVRARSPPTSVIECRAFEAEREQPWSVVRAILGAMVDVPGFRAAPAAALARAAELAPEIRERMPQLPPGSAELTATEAVLRVVTEVAAEAPLLLVIDDAASADPESFGVLGALVRRPPPGCLLVLASQAAALHASPLEQDLRQAALQVTRIELTALGERDVELMLASMLPLAPEASQSLAHRLVLGGTGNPARIESLLLGWMAGGLLAPGSDGRWGPTGDLDAVPIAPPSELLAARIARLGRDARTLTEAAATFGGEIAQEQLQALSGLTGERLSAALGEVLSHRILRQSPRGPGKFEFPTTALQQGVSAAFVSSRRRSRVHRLGPWVLAGAIIVAALALTRVLARPGAADVGQGGQIVLADVHNGTTDSALGRAFYTAATVGLQASRYVSLFPRSRVRETLQRMGRPGADSSLTEALAREVAVREDLAVVVALGVIQVDSSYLLSARLIHPESGRDLETASLRVEGRARLLEGIDRLLGRTRKALGETSRELRSNAEPLPRITTSSLEALREYVAGSDAWSRRDLPGARLHWERAIALDSTFALALAALADYWYVGVNDRTTGAQWMQRALAQMNRLTERERLRIHAQAAQRQGRGGDAVEYARMLAERYPSRDTWFNHGTVLLGLTRCREAIPSFRAALQLDSLFTNGYINLATCLQYEGQVEAALLAYAAAGRSDSLVLFRANINHEWGVAFVRAGRPAAAESVYRRMAETGSPFDRARGFRSLAWLEMYRGQFRRAVPHLVEAIKLHQSGNTNLSVFRNQVILGQAFLALGDTVAARRALDSALASETGLVLEPAFLLYLGHTQLRAGRLAAAQASLQRLVTRILPNSAYDVAVGQALESHVLLARHEVGSALSVARPVHDSRQAAFRLSALAQAYAAAGRLDSALAAAVTLSNTFSFGEESQAEWQRGPLLVARYAEARGDSATARAAYGRFLEQWKQGDQDAPELVFARRALARLQAAAPR